MKTDSTTLARQREIQRYEKIEVRHRYWIIFLVSNVLVHWFCLDSCASGMRLFFGVHPKMLAFKLLLVFNCRLYIVASGRQQTLFLFLYLVSIALTAFSFEFPWANQNSWSIRCWYVSIFDSGIPNYFSYLPIAGGRIILFTPFRSVLALCEI